MFIYDPTSLLINFESSYRDAREFLFNTVFLYYIEYANQTREYVSG